VGVKNVCKCAYVIYGWSLSSSSQFALQGGGTVASEATEETSRLLMTDECDGSSLNRENGYAKLKRNKNKVKA
jgi:hypothetical protein